MHPPLSQETIATSRMAGIIVDPEAHIGFVTRKRTIVETPAEFRRGVYDIDRIGAFTFLGGREALMRHVGTIGRFCSIASNIVTGQIEHPTDFLCAHPLFTNPPPPGAIAEFHAGNQEMIEKARRGLGKSMQKRINRINIGNDVWIGEGVYIRRGVTIGDGAVIAARSTVVADVPPYAIVGGTPARIIRYRFDASAIDDLMRLQWWKYGLSALHGVDFTDISQATSFIARNIDSGVAQVYEPDCWVFTEDGSASLVAFSDGVSK